MRHPSLFFVSGPRVQVLLELAFPKSLQWN